MLEKNDKNTKNSNETRNWVRINNYNKKMYNLKDILARDGDPNVRQNGV